MKKVLFVCVENAGRSQMAQWFAKKLGLDAESAGTLPANQVNPNAVDVMHEKGIDLSGAKPKLLTPRMLEEADLVVTMGCSIEGLCPAPLLEKMRKKQLNWDLDDPKGKRVEEVRRIRDEIERKVSDLADSFVRAHSG